MMHTSPGQSTALGFVLAAIIIFFFQSGCSRPSETPREVFEKFDSVLKRGEWNEIDLLVSENSIQYFRGLQPWIIRGDEDSLKNLPMFDRYMILFSRMNLDSLTYSDWTNWNEDIDPQIESYAVGEYLSEALGDLFFKTSLGKIDSVDGTTAGQLHRMGSPIGLSLRFTNEDGWKIELARLFQDHFEQKMGPYLTDRYKNRDRVWEMLKELYGDRINRDLYRSRIAKPSEGS